MTKKAAKKTTKKTTKKASKKAVKKAPAKKTTKKETKKVEKKPSKAEIAEQKRLEAIARYKEKQQAELNEDLKDSLENYEIEDKIEAIQEQQFETIEEAETETPQAESFRDAGPSLEEEYNPDDEPEEDSDYGFGWGYNDAFDKSEDVEEETKKEEIIDEDELYAKGLDDGKDDY